MFFVCWWFLFLSLALDAAAVVFANLKAALAKAGNDSVQPYLKKYRAGGLVGVTVYSSNPAELTKDLQVAVTQLKAAFTVTEAAKLRVSSRFRSLMLYTV